jgi:hypothetical protein
MSTEDKVTLNNITDYIDELCNTYDINGLENSFNELMEGADAHYQVYSVKSNGRTFECRLFDPNDPVHVIRQFAVIQDRLYGDQNAENRDNNKDLLDDFLEICFLAHFVPTTPTGDDETAIEIAKNENNEKRFELVHDAWAIANIIGNKNKSTHLIVDNSTNFDELYKGKNKDFYKLNDKVLQGRHLKLMVSYKNLSNTEQRKDTVQIQVYNYHKDLIEKNKKSFPSPFIAVAENISTGGKPVKKSKKTKNTKNPTRRI